MSLSDADIAFATDLFRPLHPTIRKMFGGMCLYHEGTVFALMSSDARLYLKCSGHLAAELRADGAEQFHRMPYWSLPESALDDPDEANALARRALDDLG